MKHSKIFTHLTIMLLLLMALLYMCTDLRFVHAADSGTIPMPDPGRIGSITIEMRYDGEIVVGGTLEVYRVGEIEIYINEGRSCCRFKKTGAFSSFGSSLDNVQSATLAEKLAGFVKEQNISSDYLALNDREDGRVVFDNLQTGLYLIIQGEAAEGYEALNPFLVSVPILEDGAYMYDIDAHGKFELKKMRPSPVPVTPPHEPSPTPAAPPPDEPSPAPTAVPGTPPDVPPDIPEETLNVQRQGGRGRAASPTPTGLPTLTVVAKLPQTGQLNWPVPVLAVSGMALILFGMALREQGSSRKKDDNEKHKE